VPLIWVNRLRAMRTTLAITDPRPHNMSPYVTFTLYLFAILGMVFAILLLNRILGPKPKATALKLEPFECGATAIGTVNMRAIPIKYYGVAVVFILFDLETVFLFIWALGAQPVTGFMLATYGIFAFLLALMLLYVWRSGVLEQVTS
jgi:NADH-quinone oxidoreductase subunit A